MITVTVPGEPRGKARPRVVRAKNGRVMSYTPDKTVEYEELVRARYLAAGGVRFADDASIHMIITAYFGIPKSASKKRKAAMLSGELEPTKKPDADNIAKIILDALNGIAYKDDAQVTDLHVLKEYSENPSVFVRVQELGTCQRINKRKK